MPNKLHSAYLLLFIALCLQACTPQAATSTASSPTPSAPATAPRAAKKPVADLSSCPKFTDAANPDDAETNYVIYRSALKAGDMKSAMRTWRQVYATSPAADGRRATVFTDGVAFYNNLIQENPANRAAYGDTILQLYQQARECYPGDGYMLAMQGFDSYYTYPGTASNEDVYNLFKESIETDGAEDLQYFVINPMSSLVVEMHREGKIEADEAKDIATALMTRLEKGLRECQGTDCERWRAIENYAPDALTYFETVKGFYDCNYFVDRYFGEFEDDPTDCNAISTVYGRLRYAACTESNAQFARVKQAYEDNCARVATTSSGSTGLRQAYEDLKNGNTDAAIEGFQQAAENTDDNERKGRYLLTVAKIYYRDKRSFSQARAYARQAAAADPTTGEPYMLIGTLYASSGPLCGPGTGFDSQVVTWPAIDMWQRAKSIDSSVAGKANQLINRYSQYMPSKSDIFQRGISEGDSFTVGCWIQETTRVRTP